MTTKLRLSTAYTRNRRTMTITVVMMTTTLELGTTWRRSNKRRTMMTTMA